MDTKTTNIHGTSLELTISDNIDIVNSLSTQTSCNPLSRSHSIIDTANRTEQTAQSHPQMYTSEPNCDAAWEDEGQSLSLPRILISPKAPGCSSLMQSLVPRERSSKKKVDAARLVAYWTKKMSDLTTTSLPPWLFTIPRTFSASFSNETTLSSSSIACNSFLKRSIAILVYLPGAPSL